MTTLVTLECTVRADCMDKLIAFMQQVMPDTRNYDGCQSINPYLNEDNRTILMVEYWDSKAHYEKYLAWRQETGTLDELAEMIEGPPTIRFFEPVDA